MKQETNFGYHFERELIFHTCVYMISLFCHIEHYFCLPLLFYLHALIRSLREVRAFVIPLLTDLSIFKPVFLYLKKLWFLVNLGNFHSCHSKNNSKICCILQFIFIIVKEWMSPPPKNMFRSCPLLPMNLTLFGNRALADIITLRWDHTGFRWALIQKLIS